VKNSRGFFNGHGSVRIHTMPDYADRSLILVCTVNPLICYYAFSKDVIDEKIAVGSIAIVPIMS